MVAKRSVAAAGCMTDERAAAPGTIMDATRLAAVCAKIDEYAASGAPMSGSRVEAICAMIDDGRAAAGQSRRKLRRRRSTRCVASTRRYKQIDEVGNGSFGVVVRARDRKTGETVAMKTPRARDGRMPLSVSALLREACFMETGGGHPYLVGFRGVARDPLTKRYSLVMEYVGPSLCRALNDHLDRHGCAFPEADVRRMMRQLLAGAEAMHRHHIIHRDIKPGNILVVGDDGSVSVVKICDFGLAISTAKSRPPYAVAGTDAYIAPEVLLHKRDYDERVDVWSLGCVMAELLSGEAMFDAGGDAQQLDRMFDVLGMPDEETLLTFAPALMVRKVLQRRRRRAGQLRSCCHSPLRELFPSEMLSQDGFGVLKGLLTCNPNERLTAAAALRLPWFTDTTDAPASKIDATVSSMKTASPFSRVLTGAWALLRKMASPLVRLPRHCSGTHKASSKHCLQNRTDC